MKRRWMFEHRIDREGGHVSGYEKMSMDGRKRGMVEGLVDDHPDL